MGSGHRGADTVIFSSPAMCTKDVDRNLSTNSIFDRSVYDDDV